MYVPDTLKMADLITKFLIKIFAYVNISISVIEKCFVALFSISVPDFTRQCSVTH